MAEKATVLRDTAPEFCGGEPPAGEGDEGLVVEDDGEGLVEPEGGVAEEEGDGAVAPLLPLTLTVSF